MSANINNLHTRQAYGLFVLINFMEVNVQILIIYSSAVLAVLTMGGVGSSGKKLAYLCFPLENQRVEDCLAGCQAQMLKKKG